MPSPAFPPHIIPAPGVHTHTLIVLHGRGHEASVFGPLFARDLSRSTRYPGLKLIFPAADESFSTVFQRRTRQWFDLAHQSDPDSYSIEQLQGVGDAVRYVCDIIDAEKVPSENILLGGFSQGCSTAVLALLLGGRRVGGVVGMGGWIPFTREILKDEEDQGAALGRLREKVMQASPLEDVEVARLQKTPVWLGHGGCDNVVPYNVGREMCLSLEVLGLEVQWATYPDLGHCFQVPEMFQDMARFLGERCGLANDKEQ